LLGKSGSPMADAIAAAANVWGALAGRQNRSHELPN
jgi:hypothetical protein